MAPRRASLARRGRVVVLVGAPLLAAAFIIEKNARAMGRAGLEQMTRSFRAGRLRDTFGGAGERMRNRFKREE